MTSAQYKVGIGRYDGFSTGHHSHVLVPSALLISEVRHFCLYVHFPDMITSGEQQRAT